MSFQLSDVTFDILGISKQAKAVLGSLAHHAHTDSTEARPSVATIVRESGWSEREVFRALKELRKKKLIVQTKASDKKKNTPAVYRLNFYLVSSRQDVVSGWQDVVSGRHDRTATQTQGTATQTRGGVRLAPESVLESGSESENESGSKSVHQSPTDGQMERLAVVFGERGHLGTTSFGQTKETRKFFADEIKRKGIERVCAVVEAFANDNHNDWHEIRQPAIVLVSRWSDYTAMYGDTMYAKSLKIENAAERKRFADKHREY